MKGDRLPDGMEKQRAFARKSLLVCLLSAAGAASAAWGVNYYPSQVAEGLLYFSGLSLFAAIFVLLNSDGALWRR
jgi:hypothetical protein